MLVEIFFHIQYVIVGSINMFVFGLSYDATK
jgi:hypothetical protein